MLGLIRTLLSAQMFAAQAAHLREEVRHTVTCTITFVIIAVLITIAAGFFTAAIYIVLARFYGPFSASLIIGGGYLALAIITLGISALFSRHRRVNQKQMLAQEGDLTAAAQSAINELSKAVRQINPEELAHKGGQAIARNIGPLPLAGIAIIAGYLLARRLDPK